MPHASKCWNSRFPSLTKKKNKPSDTVVVLTVNYDNQGLGKLNLMCRSEPYKKSKSLGSGRSIVARLKLKGIDGRALYYTPCNTVLELRSTLPHDLGLFQDSCCVSILSTNLNPVFQTPYARPCLTLPISYPFLATLTEAL